MLLFPAQFRRHRRLTMNRGYIRWEDASQISNRAELDAELGFFSGFWAHQCVHKQAALHMRSRIDTTVSARLLGPRGQGTDRGCNLLPGLNLVEPNVLNLVCTAIRSAQWFVTSQSSQHQDGPPCPDREPSIVPSWRDFMGLVELLICCANLRGTLGKWVV